MPRGTLVEMERFEPTCIESLDTGDRVRGGIVIETRRLPRPKRHRFWLHQGPSGRAVTASWQHPFQDEMMPVHTVRTPGDGYTYDILTTSGIYYVNGVAVRSTIQPTSVFASAVGER